MRLALAQARLSAQAGEVPVGAVLVWRPPDASAPNATVRVLACAHNQPIGLHDPTAHAEMLALREAASRLGNYRLDECELYVTLEPCAMCAQAMLHARIKRVVYGAKEPKTGAAGSVLNLFAVPQLNHHTVVEGGVLEQECAQILRDFFQQRRLTQRQLAQPLREDALRTPASAFEEAWAAHPEWQGFRVEHSDLGPLQGLRLHALDLGPRTPQASVFLHGPGQWWPQGAQWAQAQVVAGQRVLLPDLIGHGQSDKPKKAIWHSLPRHAEILWAWLDAQGVERIHLAVAPGQMQLARAFMAQAPERVMSVQALKASDLNILPTHWLQAPYPDLGHRAAQKAWQSGGWSQDRIEAGQ